QLEEALEVDALGQRIDHDRLVGAGHLHHAKQRIIGGFPQELGVDGDDRMLLEARAGGREFGRGRDQIHDHSRSAESTDMSRVFRSIRTLYFLRMSLAFSQPDDGRGGPASRGRTRTVSICGWAAGATSGFQGADPRAIRLWRMRSSVMAGALGSLTS